MRDAVDRIAYMTLLVARVRPYSRHVEYNSQVRMERTTEVRGGGLRSKVDGLEWKIYCVRERRDSEGHMPVAIYIVGSGKD